MAVVDDEEDEDVVMPAVGKVDLGKRGIVLLVVVVEIERGAY